MKKVLFILTLLLTLNSCSSDEDSNGQCPEIFNLLTDGEWKSEERIFSDLRYDDDGKYYEDGIFDGTWELSDDCESIEFETEAGFEFSFRIIEISENSLTTTLTSYTR